MRPVTSDPDRRAIDLQEWFAAHAAAGAVGDDDDHVRDTGAGCGDKIIDVGDVRIVVLDTNHPDGDYQGSVGTAQLAWLDERLAEVDAEPGPVRDHRQPPRFGVARQRARRTIRPPPRRRAARRRAPPPVRDRLAGRPPPHPPHRAAAGRRGWVLGDLDRIDHRLAVAGSRGRGRRARRRVDRDRHDTARPRRAGGQPRGAPSRCRPPIRRFQRGGDGRWAGRRDARLVLPVRTTAGRRSP